MARRAIGIRGIVQGVGFRPFVFRLAERERLAGWVRNVAGEVEIEVEGDEDRLEAFCTALRQEAPPLAVIDATAVRALPTSGEIGFAILQSEAREAAFRAVSPDAATCAACLAELFDPQDRRYRYPFLNCTHCGPRFTIIGELPYDRAATSMAPFPMCAACRHEYEDPLDRRFHAQPVACPACGPRLELIDAPGANGGAPAALCEAALARAVSMIARGGIVAVKGLGGFQLACDAGNEAAVRRLRGRKHRPGKPLAVMVADLAAAHRICRMGADEERALASSAGPIVLCRRLMAQPADPGPARNDSSQNARRGAASNGAARHHRGGAAAPPQAAPGGVIAASVAPGLSTLGIMLPATPLHHLLARDLGRPLVMTSGNLSEEPIAVTDEEALTRLAGIADGFLIHDRAIRARYDDSVVRVAVPGAAVPIRRARGLAPLPLDLGYAAGVPVLALGAHQKATFCFVEGRYAFLGQHIGDLESPRTLAALRDGAARFRSLLRLTPSALACDLHPDYVSTHEAERLAAEGGLPLVRVQHHHAHLAACLAEHRREAAVGLIFDGTGYGADGTVWGGEVLAGGAAGFERCGHLRPARLPGGARAIVRPARMALAHLLAWAADREDLIAEASKALGPIEARVVRRQAEAGVHAPWTTSAGRLFDGIGALLGLGADAGYEGEHACRLEALADEADDVGLEAAAPLPWRVTGEGSAQDPAILDPGPLVVALLTRSLAGEDARVLARAFHEALADMAVEAAARAARATGLTACALSGGCFQSALLTRLCCERLARAGLEPLIHTRVPPNDGGIALGQAVVAAHAHP